MQKLSYIRSKFLGNFSNNFLSQTSLSFKRRPLYVTHKSEIIPLSTTHKGEEQSYPIVSPNIYLKKQIPNSQRFFLAAALMQKLKHFGTIGIHVCIIPHDKRMATSLDGRNVWP